jgi:hypothetical protein
MERRKRVYRVRTIGCRSLPRLALRVRIESFKFESFKFEKSHYPTLAQLYYTSRYQLVVLPPSLVKVTATLSFHGYSSITG